MLELKPLSKEGIAGALARVERYRLLNEPEQAESRTAAATLRRSDAFDGIAMACTEEERIPKTPRTN